jgi:hypothetical protein
MRGASRAAVDARYDSFSRYPVDQQVILYLWLMRAEHPADLGFTEAPAKNGAAVAPYLLEAMRDSHSGFEIFSLVDVFLLMRLNGCLDVQSADGVMDGIRQAVDRSRIPTGIPGSAPPAGNAVLQRPPVPGALPEHCDPVIRTARDVGGLGL